MLACSLVVDTNLGCKPWMLTLDVNLGTKPWMLTLDVNLGSNPSLDANLGCKPWMQTLDANLGCKPWIQADTSMNRLLGMNTQRVTVCTCYRSRWACSMLGAHASIWCSHVNTFHYPSLHLRGRKWSIKETDSTLSSGHFSFITKHMNMREELIKSSNCTNTTRNCVLSTSS